MILHNYQSVKKNDIGLIVAIALLVIGIVMILFPYNLLNGIKWGAYTIKIDKYQDLGTFLTGITGPFLSLAAFVLLFITYKSQRAELRETRSILADQGKTQQLQQFETTFFNLVNLHHSIVNSIDLKISINRRSQTIHNSEKEIKKGRDCFVIFYKGFKNAYNYEKTKYRSDKNLTAEANELMIIKRAYYKFFRKHDYDLGHYFRNLYHILKFVNRPEVENRKMYASLLRAQLSSHELLMLFYNCLSDLGKEFKPLIPIFHFLKNMPIEDIIKPQHKEFYTKEAFEKSI